MSQIYSKQLLESIPHITNDVPYSIHRTTFDAQAEPALYLHFHPEYEFLYVAEGSLQISVNNIPYILQTGDALFIPSNTLHSATARSSTGVFYAVVFSSNLVENAQGNDSAFSFAYAPESAKYILHLSSSTTWHSHVLLYLHRLFFHSCEFSPSDEFIKNHILIIWQYMLKYHVSNYQSTSKVNHSLQSVVNFIQANYQSDISLDELANVAHMSKEHLCRLFKKYTGYTPFSYLKYYRILKSCHYLKNTEKKISEVCILCGFNNISYFNREFLRITKTTPSKYRIEKAPSINS